MSQENTMAREFFDKQASETYDQRIKPIAPIIDNLHFLIRLILKDLARDANILCVGVGTGTEILELAHAFPYWRFTGIDPSASMLDVCRRRLQQSGLLTRCELYHGCLSDLPKIEQFDAILCLLVAHFLKDSQERQALFNGMATRLKVAGYVIHAEIAMICPQQSFRTSVKNGKLSTGWRAQRKNGWRIF